MTNAPLGISLNDQQALQEVKKELKRSYYHNAKAVKSWHASLFPEGNSSNFCLDDSTNLPAFVHNLFKVVVEGEGIWERAPLGSRGASFVKDPRTQQILFVVKKNSDLPETDCIGRSEQVSDYGISLKNEEALIERERLYYHLDSKRFAGVPKTVLITFQRDYCSFQVYVPHIGSLNTLSLSQKEFYKSSLRKCVIHQFRTVNMDPTEENVLITTERAIPIDGGFSLPESINQHKWGLFAIAGKSMALHTRPFLDEPFSEEEIQYIQNLNLLKDTEKIQNLLDDESKKDIIKIFHVAHMILQEAIKFNDSITLHDVIAIRQVSCSMAGHSSLFAYILKGRNETNIAHRIQVIMKKISRIKKKLKGNAQDPDQEFLIEKEMKPLIKPLFYAYRGC